MMKKMTFSKLMKKRFKKINVLTTFACNLHCEHCTVHDAPQFKMDIEHLRKFLRHIDWIGYDTRFNLTGGEPTLYLDLFEEAVEILDCYGRDVTVLTNGYNILNVSRDTLLKIDKIFFDNHGINKERVDKCVRYVKPYTKYHVKDRLEHYDYKVANEAGDWRECNDMATKFVLTQDVVFPCCNMNRLPHMYPIMREAGWTVHNPELLYCIQNWRTTLPQEVYDVCRDYCPLPGIRKLKRNGIPGVKITLKENDVVAGCSNSTV